VIGMPVLGDESPEIIITFEEKKQENKTQISTSKEPRPAVRMVGVLRPFVV
jgi:hypothetical protein